MKRPGLLPSSDACRYIAGGIDGASNGSNG